LASSLKKESRRKIKPNKTEMLIQFGNQRIRDCECDWMPLAPSLCPHLTGPL
jgi:hypothetical protein